MARLGRMMCVAVVALLGCRADSPSPRPTPAPARGEATPPATAPVAAPAKTATLELPTRFADAPKIAAIGDVHGDLEATRAALRLVGAIGDDDHWTGGSLVVVQTGDQLDRGDHEQAILDLLERLAAEASAAGGAVHVLNGNHEYMNVVGDLRYVTPGGFADFTDVSGLDLRDPALADVPEPMRARVAAFRRGGPYARLLARRNTVVIVGDTVFVHGGVLPKHVPDGEASLRRLNADARAWLRGEDAGAETVASAIMATDGVVWTRLYSDPAQDGCEELGQMLAAVKATRLVVGHTPQMEGITSACDGRVWRIDTGMAAHYGGKPQALVIEGDRVHAVGG